jgi:hypothetical protein
VLEEPVASLLLSSMESLDSDVAVVPEDWRWGTVERGSGAVGVELVTASPLLTLGGVVTLRIGGVGIC